MNTLSDIKSTLTGADLINVRDLIDAFVEAEEAVEDGDADAIDALRAYNAILVELRNGGGDEQFRGNWYPGTLIHDRYFADYARELVEDCGDLPRDLPHYIEVDWDATARNIRSDYSCIDIDGDTYWYR